jgi:hypothetical protein
MRRFLPFGAKCGCARVLKAGRAGSARSRRSAEGGSVPDAWACPIPPRAGSRRSGPASPIARALAASEACNHSASDVLVLRRPQNPFGVD